jgi:toxin ParE1/3/4
MSAPKLRLVISPTAERDLVDIRTYSLNRWGAELSDRYERSLVEALETLSENPTIGRSDSSLGKHVRVFPIRHHRILYRKVGTTLRVVRIIHERQTTPRRPGEGAF